MKRQKKLTDAQKVGVLAGMLVWIISGLRRGVIKSKPIFNSDTNDVTALDDEITAVLNKCGIYEKEAK